MSHLPDDDTFGVLGNETADLKDQFAAAWEKLPLSRLRAFEEMDRNNPDLLVIAGVFGDAAACFEKLGVLSIRLAAMMGVATKSLLAAEAKQRRSP